MCTGSHNVNAFSLMQLHPWQTNGHSPPMKGDPLRWHETSRCITKPHSLVMACASFSYTGKHLLIFVTSALSLKVHSGHSGAPISLLCSGCVLLESCLLTSRPDYDTLHTSTTQASPTCCGPTPPTHSPISTNRNDPHDKFFFCPEEGTMLSVGVMLYRPLGGDINENGGSDFGLASLQLRWTLARVIWKWKLRFDKIVLGRACVR